MVTPYSFFSIYRAVQMHFTSSYDMIKYAGKAKSINPDAFNNRKDRQRFAFWSGKFNDPDHALQFCVFNFKSGSDWFYSSFDDANDKYLETKGFFAAFSDNIRRDREVISDAMKQKNLSVNALTSITAGGNWPPIMQMYYQKMVSVEFVSLMDHGFHFTNEWKKSIDPMIRDEGMRISKYASFVLKFKE